MSGIKCTVWLFGVLSIVTMIVAQNCQEHQLAEKIDNFCKATKPPQNEENTSELSSKMDLEKSIETKLEELRNLIRSSLKEPCKFKLINVASKKPVTMSSWWGTTKSWGRYVCCAAEYATDGNVTTFAHTQFQRTPFIYVDLRSVYYIESIEIINRSDVEVYTNGRLRNVKIEVGKTLASLKHCTDYQGPGKLAEHIKFRCSKKLSGRYVKFTQDNGSYPLQLSEIYVYALSSA